MFLPFNLLIVRNVPWTGQPHQNTDCVRVASTNYSFGCRSSVRYLGADSRAFSMNAACSGWSSCGGVIRE